MFEGWIRYQNYSVLNAFWPCSGCQVCTLDRLPCQARKVIAARMIFPHSHAQRLHAFCERHSRIPRPSSIPQQTQCTKKARYSYKGEDKRKPKKETCTADKQLHHDRNFERSGVAHGVKVAAAATDTAHLGSAPPSHCLG